MMYNIKLCVYSDIFIKINCMILLDDSIGDGEFDVSST